METSRSASDPVGTTIAGRFEVIRSLASGTMGQVYLAKQHPLDREVALKILDVRGGHAAQDFHTRFSREAAVLARLQHPNTVRVFDHGRDGDHFFLAMEYLDGPTLDAVLKADGRVAPLRALAIVRQVCAALDEAHQLGIVHRDLKPSNILIVTRGNRELPKVVDFGLVKFQDGVDATQPGIVMGTPNYMAPEQINGSPVDRRADIYALGVILFGLLTGQKPFNTTSRSEVLAAHLARPPRSLTGAAPDVILPACFEWTVQRCLEKHPDDRFATMLELARALNACELALRYPALRGVQVGMERGRTILPAEITGVDAGFAGVREPDPLVVTPSLVTPAGSTMRGVLIGVTAMGLLATALLVVVFGLLILQQQSGRLVAVPVPVAPSEPTSRIVVEPTVPVAAQPVAAPGPLPGPEPVAAPVPEPVAAPGPEPVATPVPEPVATPGPEPVPVPAPEPAPAPKPKPRPKPVPAPTPAPAPKPTGKPLLLER